MAPPRTSATRPRTEGRSSWRKGRGIVAISLCTDPHNPTSTRVLSARRSRQTTCPGRSEPRPHPAGVPPPRCLFLSDTSPVRRVPRLRPEFRRLAFACSSGLRPAPRRGIRGGSRGGRVRRVCLFRRSRRSRWWLRRSRSLSTVFDHRFVELAGGIAEVIDRDLEFFLEDLARACDFFFQFCGPEFGQVEVVDRVGGQLPARRDHRLDVRFVEVRAFRLQVEDARPAVFAQGRQGEGVLGAVAVVEGEDDRLRRQLAAVVPGFLAPVRASPPRSRVLRASPSAFRSRCGRRRVRGTARLRAGLPRTWYSRIGTGPVSGFQSACGVALVTFCDSAFFGFALAGCFVSSRPSRHRSCRRLRRPPS